MRLLIIEDEKELAESIIAFISKEGFNCESVERYEEAKELIHTNEYDFALIDIMLPDGNGIELINIIKYEQPRCGVIVISAKGSLDDKILGLEIGADDYITKPFHLAELNARIKSVMRRKDFDGNKKIILNELTVDTEKRELSINNVLVDLTKREFDILLFFISNKERVLTKEAITEHVWGDDSNAFDNLDFVYTHIKNLRKKIKDAGAKDYIKSVYGIGYKFTLQ